MTEINKDFQFRNTKSKRYDIETETHNYFANDILVHNSSSWIIYDPEKSELGFFPGGAKLETFTPIFADDLYDRMRELFDNKKVIIFGEHYGNSIQKMSTVYGKEHRFALFDVRIGGYWLSFDKTLKIGEELGLECVPAEIVKCELEILNKYGDMPSEVAIRNGMGDNHKREGIVIRPLMEFSHNDGKRILAKHKSLEFRETKTPREVTDDKLKVLEDARDIAEEWVTEQRLLHVLDAFTDPDLKDTRNIINAMIDDIDVEAKDKIVMTREAKKQIGNRTAKLFKKHLMKVEYE